MKTLSITLENLGNGILRATGRNRGVAVSTKQGTDAKALVFAVMAETCFAHRVSGDKYDMEHIRLNAEAVAAIA